jgi:N-acetylmuramoyl-L-alanine amidase
VNYKRIAAHEADFRAMGKDSDGKAFKLTPGSVAVPHSTDRLNVVMAKPANGDQSFFYGDQRPEKRRVALHHTAGYLKGDMAALTRRDNHVSTPFVIARDGTVYQLFSSANWSYHLGPGAAGGNKEMSSSAVAVELSNVGYLTRKGDVLQDPYGEEYCTLADHDAYVELANPFRGQVYFARFTEAQYFSVGTLLRYLLPTYGIPAAFLPESQRYDVFPSVAQFRGITSHVNYQPQSYGKWDLGPAFDWRRVIAGVQAAAQRRAAAA